MLPWRREQLDPYGDPTVEAWKLSVQGQKCSIKQSSSVTGFGEPTF